MGGGGSVSVSCLRWKSKASIQWLNGVHVSARPHARRSAQAADWERIPTLPTEDGRVAGQLTPTVSQRKTTKVASQDTTPDPEATSDTQPQWPGSIKHKF